MIIKFKTYHLWRKRNTQLHTNLTSYLANWGYFSHENKFLLRFYLPCTQHSHILSLFFFLLQRKACSHILQHLQTLATYSSQCTQIIFALIHRQILQESNHSFSELWKKDYFNTFFFFSWHLTSFLFSSNNNTLSDVSWVSFIGKAKPEFHFYMVCCGIKLHGIVHLATHAHK